MQKNVNQLVPNLLIVVLVLALVVVEVVEY